MTKIRHLVTIVFPKLNPTPYIESLRHHAALCRTYQLCKQQSQLVSNYSEALEQLRQLSILLLFQLQEYSNHAPVTTPQISQVNSQTFRNNTILLWSLSAQNCYSNSWIQTVYCFNDTRQTVLNNTCCSAVRTRRPTLVSEIRLSWTLERQRLKESFLWRRSRGFNLT